MVLILARQSREGGVVAHGCAVNESKDGEVVHGCTVNGAKDANPVRQIAFYLLDPRPPPSRGRPRIRGRRIEDNFTANAYVSTILI